MTTSLLCVKKSFSIDSKQLFSLSLLPSRKKTLPKRVFQNEWKNKIHIAQDFDTLPQEFLSNFS